MRGFRVLYELLRKVENALCAVGLLFCSALVFFQVLNRYWFQVEIVWINDFAVYVFVFYILFALMLTTREDGHIALDMLGDKLFGASPVRRRAYGLFLRLVSLSVAAAALYPMWQFAARAFKYPQYATLVRWFNTSWMLECMFAAMCFITLHLLVLVVKDTVALRSLLRESANNTREI